MPSPRTLKILCGTDLLAKTDSALERAGMLAERLEAELAIVHAVPEAEPPHLLEDELRRAGGELRRRAMPPRWRYRVAPTFEIRAGSPAQVLIETARDLQPSLIVLGSHRRRPYGDALRGTIAERILKQLDCPVLVVRRVPWRAYRRVLLVLDRAGSAELIDAAGRLVLHGGARATLMQAHESLGAGMSMAPGDSTMRAVGPSPIAAQPEGCGSTLPAGQAPRLAVIHEQAMKTDVIHGRAGTSSPDLLVVGAGRRGWMRRMFLGDAVSHALAMRGADVLIVPRHRECAVPRRDPDSRGARRWSALPRMLRGREPCRPGIGGAVQDPTR